MQHRKDIDGLRSLAILPVVAFHAFPRYAPGGFVGVDVFFVISGFLITSIIFNEVSAGRFSLATFYERRIRRIVPALAAMVLLCAPAAWFLLFPTDFHEFGRSVAATMLSGSNIFFWFRTDYFSPQADAQPLLHTWSLGVEEQFYIFFPFLLMALHGKSRRTHLLVLGGLAVASLIAAEAAVRLMPTFAFYWLPTRAWELLIGSLLAVGVPAAPRSKIVREGVAIAGVLAIAAAVLIYKRNTPFPGLHALLPCLGAAMLLWTAPGTLAGRVLSLPPLVGVGLISYSLYLWHWPLLVFARTAVGEGKLVVLAAVALAFVMATLSLYLVEAPFRRRTALFTRQRILAGGGAVLATAAVAGVAVSAAPTGFQRFSPQVAHVADYLNYLDMPEQQIQFRRGVCFISGQFGNPKQFDDAQCMQGKGQHRVLVFGDSHAAHLWYGVKHALPNDAVLQASYSGCKPTIPTHGVTECVGFVNGIYARVLGDERPDLLVLSARWTKSDIPALVGTVHKLNEAGVPFVVLGPIVEYDRPLPWLLAQGMMRGDPNFAAEHRKPNPDRLVRAAVEGAGGRYLSTYDVLCPEGRCLETADGSPVQFDYGHLTMAGAVRLGSGLAPGLTTAEFHPPRPGVQRIALVR